MQTVTVTSNKNTYTVQIRDVADQSVLNEIFKFHEYRRAEEIIKNATNPILDVGAHAGFFALWARSINSNVPIICVEPHPDNVLVLNHHLIQNKILGVEVVHGALAKESGKRNLEVSRDTHNHKLISERTKKSIAVPAVSLLDIAKKYTVEKFSLVKMDIEGGEYELFRSWGAEEYKKIASLVMEYHTTTEGHPDEVEKTLRENGFGVQKFVSQFVKTMGFFLATNKRI